MRAFVIVSVSLLLLISACGTSRDQNNTVSLDPQTSELPSGNNGTVTTNPAKREERYYHRTDVQLAGFAAWKPGFEKA
ncbi:MAG: hypothetical protein IJM14_09435 [Lachnospiraceae bacterium]|nr:hypothetical protein [Lachnospiraceae bacterium]